MQQKDQEHTIRRRNARFQELAPGMMLFGRICRNWLWTTISFSTFLLAGYLYLRYAIPEYRITASLLIRDDGRGGEPGDAALLESMGFPQLPSSVDNEIELLKSRKLVEQVVEDLQLYVQYFAVGRVRAAELYDKSPYKLIFVKSTKNSRLLPVSYQLNVARHGRYQLISGSQHYGGILNQAISLPQGIARVIPTRFRPSDTYRYIIRISPKDHFTKYYQNGLKINAANKMASIVNLSMTHPIPEKGEAFLNRLITNYLKTSVGDKNRVAESTLTFIDKNLRQVAQELSITELGIQNFKRRYHLTDFQEDIRSLGQNADEVSEEQNTVSVQLKILQMLSQYLTRDVEHVVPSSLYLQDPNFLSLVNKYNDVILTREKAVGSVSNLHPQIITLNNQIQNLRADLLASIQAQIREVKVREQEMQVHAAYFRREVDSFPSRERVLLDLSRQQQINQELYTFLLKKRVETAISKSAVTANARIVDPPKASHEPFRPSKQIVFLISGILGLGVPVAVVHLRHIFNTRVLDKSEIMDHCDASVLAEIAHFRNHQQAFVERPQGRITEQFRTLRTNIQFLKNHQSCQIILLTSSMGSEGKSMIAINLASSFASAGKKTLLLEMDLRKPSIPKYLWLSSIGFTDLIINNLRPEEAIQSFGKSAFDVLTSGTSPPDPVRFLTLPDVDLYIQTLREQYDYIIFDTPPIGLVADARLLGRFADISLFIIRRGFTRKQQLEKLQELTAEKQLPELYVIFNDTKIFHKYESGYYTDPEKYDWATNVYHFIRSIPNKIKS